MARWSTRSIRNRNSSLPQPHSGGGRPLCGAGFEGGSSNTASPHSCNCWVSSSDTGPGGQSFLQDPPSSWVAEYGGSLRNQWAQRILTACHWCIFRFHNSYEFSVLTARWISRVFTMHMPGWVSPSPLEADSGVTSLDLSWFYFVLSVKPCWRCGAGPGWEARVLPAPCTWWAGGHGERRGKEGLEGRHPALHSSQAGASQTCQGHRPKAERPGVITKTCYYTWNAFSGNLLRQKATQVIWGVKKRGRSVDPGQSSLSICS